MEEALALAEEAAADGETPVGAVIVDREFSAMMKEALASAKVKPVRLQETGYEFKHPTLKEALKAVL